MQGEYFVFIDPDDFYPNNEVLSKLYNTLKEQNVLVCGGSLAYYKNEVISPLPPNLQKAVFENDGLMSFSNYQFDYYYQRFIYPTQVLRDNNLYFPEYRRYQDPPFFIAFMAKVEKFYALKDDVYCYRSIPKQNTFTSIQTIDMLKGIRDCLLLTKQNKYDILYDAILKRINSNYFVDILKNNIQDITVEKEIKNILSIIDDNHKNQLNLFFHQYLQTPKVSLIIPVYNVEKYLKQCLDSVVNQTLKDIEIICVNDGSPDNSLNILREYEKKDKRIIIIDQKNQGLGAARNAGFSICKGEYIYFLDSDDWLELDALEELYSKAKLCNADIVLFGAKIFDEQTKKIQKVDWIFRADMLSNRDTFCYKDMSDNLFQVSQPGMPFKLFNKKLWKSNNIRFQNIKFEDVYPYLLSMSLATNITYINKPFYNYRKNVSSSITSNKTSFVNDIFEAFNEAKKELERRNLFYFVEKSFYRRYLDSLTWILRGFTESQVSDKELFIELCKKNLPKEYFVQLLSENKILNTSTIFKYQLANDDVIISLTSYPARIKTVHKTIETLLNQSHKANKIILWLAEEQFPNKAKDLPKELVDLTNNGLTISWCEDIKSYKKLIPALKLYPNSIIVTADDDLYYQKTWLEKLYLAYLKQPNIVHCHRAHRITFENGQIEPYKNWKFSVEKANLSFLNFLTSGGGALYPPNIFYKDILKKEIFTKLSPKADDIWFWAMVVLNGVKINVVDNSDRNLSYVEDTQEVGLWHQNITNGDNDKQLGNLFRYYPQLLKVIQHSLENTDISLEQIKDILESNVLVNTQFKYSLRISDNRIVVIDILDMKIAYDIILRKDNTTVSIVLRKDCDMNVINKLYPLFSKDKNKKTIFITSTSTIQTSLVDFIKKEIDRVVNQALLIKQVQIA
jgi:glycosyltransferase involved in cell wall biosynthesis